MNLSRKDAKTQRDRLMKTKWVWIGGIVVVFVAILDGVEAQHRPVRGDYVSHNTCKLCHNQTEHGTQWDIWAASAHARAYETLFNEESQRIAREMGLDEPAHEAAQCLRCHVTAYDPQRDAPPAPLRIEDGVQCESCHGPGSRHVPAARRRWMQGDTTAQIQGTIQRPDQRTCVRCHRSQSPTWDPERFTLPDGSTSPFHYPTAFEMIEHTLHEPMLSDESTTE